jgi:hypothetical protein
MPIKRYSNKTASFAYVSKAVQRTYIALTKGTLQNHKLEYPVVLNAVLDGGNDISNY